MREGLIFLTEGVGKRSSGRRCDISREKFGKASVPQEEGTGRC